VLLQKKQQQQQQVKKRGNFYFRQANVTIRTLIGSWALFEKSTTLLCLNI